MSEIERFRDEMIANEAWQAELSKATTLDEAVSTAASLASANGYDLGEADFRAAAERLSSRELSEKELSFVTGGTYLPPGY